MEDAGLQSQSNPFTSLTSLLVYKKNIKETRRIISGSVCSQSILRVVKERAERELRKS